MDQLPRLGKRELICLLLLTCNYVVSVWRGFLFLWMLGMGYVILLWHSLSLPYNYLGSDYAPTLKKLVAHIAFGACVGACVRGSQSLLPTLTFKPFKLES